MRIEEATPQSDYTLKIITDDGRADMFDVRPYLKFESFKELVSRGFVIN